MIIRHLMTGILALITTTSHAYTVSEGSGIFTDFSNDSVMPTYTGLLDIGSNSISGSTSFIGSAADTDYFSFAVQSGSKLTSLVTDYVSDDYFHVSVGLYEIQAADSLSFLGGFRLGDAYFDVVNPVLSSGTNILTYLGFDSLESSEYAIGLAGFTKRGGYDVNLDYTFTANTSPVPLPSTAWLFVVGLAGLLKTAWKHKSK
ncbi:MAG: hypothetical protein OEW89_05625 [Gammaproteobacteria bacterium]|nr:hypothetical protein [Gammaproteobacteria bacterium]MDH5594611.1 hypothetical protein [Gammaproteobacteria bacterium]